MSAADAAQAPFIAAVEAIYAAAPDPSRWPDTLQLIADCFSDVGGVILWQRDDGSIGTIVSPSLRAAQDDYETGWWRHDIRAQRAIEFGVRIAGGAVTERHFTSPDEMDTHPFYNEFLAKHGLKWVAGTMIAPDPRIMVALSLQRAAVKDPFNDDELEQFARLGRHVENSLRLSVRLLDAELSNLGLREALSRLGIGLFALDSLGRVIFSNAAGQRLLGKGLSIVDQRLMTPRAAARGEFEQAVASASRGLPSDLTTDPRPILVDRAGVERPLVIYVLPLVFTQGPINEFLSHVRALVLVMDPASDSPPDPSVVRDVLGLTLSEARVAALVGSGLPPREAAEKLEITEETARTALKRVFSKVGVSRQSELAALLTKLVLR